MLRRSAILLPIGLLAVVGGLLAVTYTPAPVQPAVRSYASSMDPVVSAAKLPEPPIASSYGLPVRLQISRLNVDAKVLYMGTTKTGTMQVPGNVVDVGWYKFGHLPGNEGTAVIAGHLDGLRAEPGVFSNLGKMQPGDIVSVVDNAGSVAKFKVTMSKKYAQNEQPDTVFSSTTGSHLNLITCTGAWDKTAHQFASRLVVFTDRI